MKRRGLVILGFLFSVAPPLIATATYFPLWYYEGVEVLISGITLFFLLISAIPLIRIFKEKLKSPSAPMIWLILFILFFSIDKIADKCVIISLVGLIGNLIGAALYKVAKKASEI